ncbi:MAG: hypothetical protein GVY11_05730 [Gammaproteobacteria bacterium]|nr:hypothetical protein [Gammaproteobacteria bacterium]
MTHTLLIQFQITLCALGLIAARISLGPHQQDFIPPDALVQHVGVVIDRPGALFKLNGSFRTPEVRQNPVSIRFDALREECHRLFGIPGIIECLPKAVVSARRLY